MNLTSFNSTLLGAFAPLGAALAVPHLSLHAAVVLSSPGPTICILLSIWVLMGVWPLVLMCRPVWRARRFPSNPTRLPPAESELSVLTAGHLARIGKIGRNANGRGVTRFAFTNAEDAAFAYAIEVLHSYGYTVEADHFGNLRARRMETRRKPRVMLITHMDSVADGGDYDGIVGFIVAVEAARIANAAGCRLGLEIVIFRAEESTRFGKACLGSRAAFGFLRNEELDELRDTLNVGGTATLRHALVKAGLDASKVGTASLDPGDFIASFEVHIEQARNLERRGGGLGVVTSIRAPERRTVRVCGRRCLRAVAEIIRSVEAVAEIHARLLMDIVATVGRVEGFFIGADKINAIPGSVTLPLARPLTLAEMSVIRQLAEPRRVKVITDPWKPTSLQFKGVTDHSGATPMTREHRHDALVAAAEAVSFLDEAVFCDPGEILIYIDVRSNFVPTRAHVWREMLKKIYEIRQRFDVDIHVSQPIESTDPIRSLDPDLQNLLMDSGRKLGINMTKLPSGAGHDSLIVAQAGVPSAMIFVPSVGGLSHCPEELTHTSDIVNAIRLQATALQQLSRRWWTTGRRRSAIKDAILK